MGATLDDSKRHQRERADQERECEAAPSLEGPSHPGIDEDVHAPKASGHHREADAEAIQAVSPAARQRHDPRCSQPDPEEIDAAPGAADCHRQRTDELDRHGDPQRDTVKRLIEAQVHPGQHEPEQGHQAEITERARLDARPPNRQQHHACEHQAQQDRAGRTDRAEQLRGQRRAELDRSNRAQDERARWRAGERVEPGSVGAGATPAPTVTRRYDVGTPFAGGVGWVPVYGVIGPVGLGSVANGPAE